MALDILAKKEDKLNWLIENLDLSKKVIKPLLNENLKYLGEVTRLSKKQVEALPNYGAQCVSELSEFLWKHGLDFNQQPITTDETKTTIICDISKDNADYYVEAYTKEYHLDENKVVRETGTTRLCYIAGYRDYDLEETEQITVLLRLRDDIKDFYSRYPDGEVTVKLVIKEDYVNT